MEGFYARRAGENGAMLGNMDGLALLAKRSSLEIMTQKVRKDATVWLSPGTGDEDFEFFFVHEGEVEINLDDEIMIFRPGDSFFIQGLKQNVFLRCTQPTLLLYVSTCPVFTEQAYWQEELKSMVQRIDEKDHYTTRHSRAVMRYAVKLYEQLKDECGELSLEDYVVASLFHDVGKCNIPGEILRKKGDLTAVEYRAIMRHPIDGARLLEPIFGKPIAELARSHHERMDGSGYPFGLKGEEIPFGARIMAVADAFDAMTSDRGYNRVKTFEEAANELCHMPDAFDRRVTQTLRELVRQGAIRHEEEENEQS